MGQRSSGMCRRADEFPASMEYGTNPRASSSSDRHDGTAYRADADVRPGLEHQRVTELRGGGTRLREGHRHRRRWRRESDLLHRLSEATLEQRRPHRLERRMAGVSALAPEPRERFADAKLTLSDVGATRSMEPRWNSSVSHSVNSSERAGDGQLAHAARVEREASTVPAPITERDDGHAGTAERADEGDAGREAGIEHGHRAVALGTDVRAPVDPQPPRRHGGRIEGTGDGRSHGLRRPHGRAARRLRL